MLTGEGVTKKQKFLRVTERNSWERETWHFLFKDSKKNREFFTNAKKCVKKDSTYSFKIDSLSEDEIEIRKNCRVTTYMKRYNFMDRVTTYMKRYNFMEGDYDWEKGLKRLKKEDEYRLDDPFYKGQFDEFKV